MIAARFRRRHCVPQKETVFSFSDWTQRKMYNWGVRRGKSQDLTSIVREGSLTLWYWKEPLIPRDLNATGTKATVDA